MENEIRFYLKQIKMAMAPLTEEEEQQIATNASCDEEDYRMVREVFKPTHLIAAVALPSGSTEIAINTDYIAEKIDYILEAYDQDMHLKTNNDITVRNIMIV